MSTKWIFDLDDTLYSMSSLVTYIESENSKFLNYTKLEKDEFLTILLSILHGEKIIYTNGTRGHMNLVMEKIGITKLFQKLNYREKTGLKPKSESFQKFIKLNNISNSDTCFFFEDNILNLIGAKKYNWTPILIQPNILLHETIRNKTHIQYIFKDIYEALLFFIEAQI